MLLKKGSSDQGANRQVHFLQGNLNFLNFPCGVVDGQFGPLTEGATKNYQEVRGLQVDGEVDVIPPRNGETWTHLLGEVVWVQNKLREHGFDPGVSDGLAGPHTTGATIAFQVSYNLVPDGIAGSNTRGALATPEPGPVPTPPIPPIVPPIAHNIVIIPRSAWGALPSKLPNPENAKTFEVVHHTESVIPVGQNEFAEILGIQRFHMFTRGWNDIAYNLLMLRDGRWVEGRGIYAVAAACPGRNVDGVNVALLGNYQIENPTAVQINSLNNLTTYLKAQAHIHTVGGHRDWYSTDCPGDNLYPRFAR